MFSPTIALGNASKCDAQKHGKHIVKVSQKCKVDKKTEEDILSKVNGKDHEANRRTFEELSGKYIDAERECRTASTNYLKNCPNDADPETLKSAEDFLNNEAPTKQVLYDERAIRSRQAHEQSTDPNTNDRQSTDPNADKGMMHLGGPKKDEPDGSDFGRDPADEVASKKQNSGGLAPKASSEEADLKKQVKVSPATEEKQRRSSSIFGRKYKEAHRESLEKEAELTKRGARATEAIAADREAHKAWIASLKEDKSQGSQAILKTVEQAGKEVKTWELKNPKASALKYYKFKREVLVPKYSQQQQQLKEQTEHEYKSLTKHRTPSYQSPKIKNFIADKVPQNSNPLKSNTESVQNKISQLPFYRNGDRSFSPLEILAQRKKEREQRQKNEKEKEAYAGLAQKDQKNTNDLPKDSLKSIEDTEKKERNNFNAIALQGMSIQHHENSIENHSPHFSHSSIPQSQRALNKPKPSYKTKRFVESEPPPRPVNLQTNSPQIVLPSEELPTLPIITTEKITEDENDFIREDPLAVLDISTKVDDASNEKKEEERKGFLSSLKNLLGIGKEDKKEDKAKKRNIASIKPETEIKNQSSFLDDTIDFFSDLFSSDESKSVAEETLKSEKWFGEDTKNDEDVVVLGVQGDIVEDEKKREQILENTKEVRLALQGKSLEELADELKMGDKVPEVGDNPNLYGSP